MRSNLVPIALLSVVVAITISILVVLIFLYPTDANANNQPRSNPKTDAYAAIAVVFPKRFQSAARCIVRKEIGQHHKSRYRSVYSIAIGTVGEVGPWQFHPGWWKGWWYRTPSGRWVQNLPKFPHPWKLRHDALYATRAAFELFKSAGFRFRQHWYHSSKKCGVA